MSTAGDGPVPDEPIRLASAVNFRDVAGTGAGYPTRDGGRVRRGVLYRSNHLQLTAEDALRLGDLGIAVVHDLRTDEEVAAKPDVAIPGATWRHVGGTGDPTAGMTQATDAASMAARMRGGYDSFVRTTEARTSFATLLTGLADGPVPQVFHCAGGKDRTGWATALVLEIAGVDRDTILADYLLTADHSAVTYTALLEAVAEHQGVERARILGPALAVDPTYLSASYDAVTELYGDVDGYLSDGLGLTSATVATLRNRLVEAPAYDA